MTRVLCGMPSKGDDDRRYDRCIDPHIPVNGPDKHVRPVASKNLRNPNLGITEICAMVCGLHKVINSMSSRGTEDKVNVFLISLQEGSDKSDKGSD